MKIEKEKAPFVLLSVEENTNPAHARYDCDVIT
jgi:hypothetical protein